MKLGSLKRVMMSDVPGAEPWFQTFLNHYNPFATQVTQALGQQITIADNTNCAFMDVELFHGVERVLAAPMDNCEGLLAYAAKEIVNGKPSTRVGVRITVRRITSGTFGITAFYPFEEQHIVVQATGAQSINHNTTTTLTYAATPVRSVGTLLTYNGTDTITTAAAGVFEIVAHGSFVTAVGGSRAVLIQVSGVTQTRNETPAPAGNGWALNAIPPPLALAAGATVVGRVFQNQTAVAALNTDGTPRPSLSVRMIDRAATFKASVSCLFLGA